MRELESSLQSFWEFLLKAQLVRPTAAPYFVRWVRRFLSRPASDEPLADQVRAFCEELERNGGVEDWQVRQADQALRMYFVNFLKRTEWHRRPASTSSGPCRPCRGPRHGPVRTHEHQSLAEVKVLDPQFAATHRAFWCECFSANSYSRRTMSAYLRRS